VILGSLLPYFVFAQIALQAFQNFLERDDNLRLANVKNVAAVREFYSTSKYSFAWLVPDGQNRLRSVRRLLQEAPAAGLIMYNYHISLIDSLTAGKISFVSPIDSFTTEVKLTDAILQFLHDITYGRNTPLLGYNGITNERQQCRSLANSLAVSIYSYRLDSLLNEVEPTTEVYRAIRNKLTWLQQIVREKNFEEVVIQAKQVTRTNHSLIKKFYQLGILLSEPDSLTIEQFSTAVKDAQRLFDLIPDGRLQPTLLARLNVPVKGRIQQLVASLDAYRWLYCLQRNQPVIVVNIPAAFLKVYAADTIMLQMKVVTGKPSTPSPTLSSTITEVVLYPYWMVPRSIATKELLPLIKRNPGFLDDGGYQLLNSQGNIIDPYTVDWLSVTKANFSYSIRQSTGCDNSLGLIKLDFYNPFSVYLHDTPAKNLFQRQKRFFSHGCIRLEHAFALARLLLKDNTEAVDTLSQKGCLLHKKPVPVAASQPMQLVVWYNLVDTDNDGSLVFYDDIYRRNIAVKSRKN
jgi:murein L,D-transpeptidase YcbB/YkuD